MTADMNHTSSSFGAYEAVRILIPGCYFAALLLVFLYLLSAALGRPLDLEGMKLLLIFTTVAVVSGLTLYAKEGTKRRRAFQENQPSLYIKTKARSMPDLPVMEESDARQLYFYLLNNFVPSVFHEKIFFFGTIYHIMIQIRRTSLWFAVLSSIAVVLALAAVLAASSANDLIAFAAVAWIMYLLNVRYNKADRKMQENYQDQIYWMEMNNDLIESLLRKRHTPHS